MRSKSSKALNSTGIRSTETSVGRYHSESASIVARDKASENETSKESTSSKGTEGGKSTGNAGKGFWSLILCD